MNEPVRKGNVYSSPGGSTYIVSNLWPASCTVKNIRSNKEYIIKLAALANEYELIGTPYTGNI
jgi:hypothetical protein